MSGQIDQASQEPPRTVVELVRRQHAEDFADRQWSMWARRWRSRVGMPRLLAEKMIWAAHSLLATVPLATFSRSKDPRDREVGEKLVEARRVVAELGSGTTNLSWERFNHGRR